MLLSLSSLGGHHRTRTNIGLCLIAALFLVASLGFLISNSIGESLRGVGLYSLSPSPSHADHFRLSGPTPQLTADDRYTDVIINLNTSDPHPPSGLNFANLRYAVFLPTYVDHFSLAVDFFQSLRCLCLDHAEINFYVIVSDTAEARDFRQQLDNLKPCEHSFGRWGVPRSNVGGPIPHVNILNIYDLLPDQLKSPDVTPSDTSKVLERHGKYAYQSVKKMAPAVLIDYDYGLWIDSESIAVRPFRFRETFEAAIRVPTVWRSRMCNTDMMRDLMANAAKVLGRSVDSFGPAAWLLESTQWIIEKAVIMDMVQHVEAAHDRPFWAIYSENGLPFEILLYNLHIWARKMETVDTIFSKYMVLETEREMLRFGIAPAFPEIEFQMGTGFLERSSSLLKHASVQPQLSAFLRRYGQRLWRLEDLDIAAPDVLQRMLLDTPLDLLVSGATPLHRWWKEMEENKLVSRRRA
ncbi:hypothetical protein G6O67_001038 [Ophiocordyceps sinensis]|uniref:Uncharacterized protein n=1 Tax=Ophiocordyceps sinensis TaxID=72228 RepID=A0A8H4PWU4_9HYPO|nr:hypothetical protein G6O67_001038 [Ophiocordyceps sinensis]